MYRPFHLPPPLSAKLCASSKPPTPPKGGIISPYDSCRLTAQRGEVTWLWPHSWKYAEPSLKYFDQKPMLFPLSLLLLKTNEMKDDSQAPPAAH